VLLGKDGHQVPTDPCADGGVSLRYASLAQALRDAALRARLVASASAGNSDGLTQNDD
jgi:hypothetical protein